MVLSDGKITTCCADTRGQLALGRLGEGTPAEIYAGERFVELRRRHAARDFPAPCNTCGECAVPGVSGRFS